MNQRFDRRSDLFASLLNPHSQSLLLRAGISAGQRVVDLGCGQGNMTLWLNDRVGAAGRVFAIDRSADKLNELAERIALGSGERVVGLHGDAAELLMTLGGVDLVYSRFVLMHVSSPSALLSAVHASLQECGVAVFEEPILGATFTHPPSTLWSGSIAAYEGLCTRTGVRPNYGADLLGDLAAAGFDVVSAVQVQPIVTPAFALDYTRSALAAHHAEYLSHGVLTEAEYTQVYHSLDDVDTTSIEWCGFHGVMQVVCAAGRRAPGPASPAPRAAGGMPS